VFPLQKQTVDDEYALTSLQNDTRMERSGCAIHNAAEPIGSEITASDGYRCEIRKL